MARREYARLAVAVWDDDDFTQLDPLAQWLYMHLLTHPTLSFCGVADWRPRHVAAAAAGLTVDDVVGAMKTLEAARFVVVDLATEEALVRSFVRHDGLLGNPNVVTAMVREFRMIASRFLRGVVVHELRRLHVEHPELRGWPKAQLLLDRTSIDPYTEPTDPSGGGSGSPSGRGSGTPSGSPFDTPSDSPSPTPSGSPSGSPFDPSGEGLPDPLAHPLGEGVPHSLLPPPSSLLPAPAPPPAAPQGGAARTGTRAGDEPPPRCPRHSEQPADGPCPACGDARRAHERWARDRDQRRRDTGPVIGQDCPDHPGEPAGRCGRCAASAVPTPPDLRALRDQHRRAS